LLLTYNKVLQTKQFQFQKLKSGKELRIKEKMLLNRQM